jgi:hypothetical protein
LPSLHVRIMRRREEKEKREIEEGRERGFEIPFKCKH